MSTHRDCGEPIRWAKRPDGNSWLPPLDYQGEAFILTRSENGTDEFIGSEVHTYKIHHCDPDKVIAWQEYQAKMADIQGREPPQTTYAVSRERDREAAWEQAIKKVCPKCDAPKKVRCKSLGYNAKKKEKETGEITETRWPHPERWTAQ